MNYLDIIMLILFLGITAYIGFASSKKVESTSEFILAGRKLTKLQATFSLAASDMGGSSIVGACAFVYAVGIAGAWWNISAAPAFLLLGFLVTKKLREMELTTVPEFIGNRYSKRLGTFSALLHFIGIVTMVSSQFIVASATIHAITGVSQTVALVISLVFVLAYTVGGGLIAVVNTDVFQFFVLIISIVIMIPLALSSAGGISGIVETVPESFTSLGALGFWEPLSYALMALFTYGTNQAYVQRAFAAKDPQTASFAFNTTGIIYIFYGFAVGLLGLCMVVLLPNLADPNLGFAQLIMTVLPHGLVGIALSGLFAATMSTADSLLLSASSMFVNDIYLPLKKNVSDDTVLKVSRFTILGVAVASMILSTFFESIVSAVYIACLLYSAVVFFPFILGIFNKKITTLAAECAVVSAFIVGVISEFYLSGRFEGFLGLPSNILCSLTALIVLFVISAFSKDKQLN